ncbi:MAG TPA: DNA internalization-related competence protein ComEC/Rec2 [Dongiaceae bacterium]|nr:DNA internalization-related competence protein ComEC/Rec2 [Dongiaceae bacterium]
MARAPLFLPALAFVCAIAAEAHGLAALACAAAVGTLAYRRLRAVAAFALAGLLVASWRGHPLMISEESRTERFSGTVVGDVLTDENGARFPFALDGAFVVRAHVRDAAVVPGERLVVRGRLVPFDEARNPGEPSRRAIALGEGLAGELAGNRIVARAPPDPHDLRAWCARLRASLSVRLRTVIAEPEATVIAGALWGERGTLPPELRDDFQATGTVHVLVTAGLHLGVIARLLLCALRLLRIPRAAASLAAIPAVVSYAWLSGAHLPSQRAAAMVCAALVARACGARLVSWSSLALAALIVAALWPASVTTVSFALSFSCVAAIVLFARTIEHALERWQVPDRAREPLALTVATQIGVWPLSAATFGVVAPYAVLANAVVVPATAAGMVAGIAALLLAHVPVAGGFAATLATWDVDAILRVVGTVASVPGARVWVAPPPALAIVAYDALAVAAAALLRRSARAAVALLALASAGVLLTTLRPPDGKLTITMLDVGQGDAIVVRTPRGHVILIDSGGRLERGPGTRGRSPAELVGERVVLAYLKRAGIRSVDLLVNTHPHGDHVGGCLPILEALRVAAIADSGQSYGGRAFSDCMTAARRAHVPVVLARRGMRYATGDGVTLEVLAPEEPLLANGPNDVNENSVVMRLGYHCRRCDRPVRILFTGDAGASSEARMLAAGIDVEADVLKVGHHGSAYSSTPAFIAAVRPRIALISVGRHNLFGHPASATLGVLHEFGAAVYRTDRCGAIVIQTGAEATKATTMIPCT